MRSKNKFAFAISGIVMIVIFWIYYIMVNPDDNNPALIRFVSIEQLIAEELPGRVKLGGNVQTGSIAISETNLLDVNFVLEQGDELLPVYFHGTRPDLFKDGVEVIIEGNIKDDKFVADQLQTKCASRYEGDLRDETSYNLEEL